MKKILISILVLFCAISSYAQSGFPNNQTVSNGQTLYHARGGLTGDSGLVLISFPDTTTANFGPYIKYTDGLLIKVHDTIFMRDLAKFKWINYVQTNVFTTNCISHKESGSVIWDSLLVFHSTLFNYFIGCRPFSAQPTSFTLDPAYVTAGRTDVWIVDTFGIISVLKGDSSGLVPQADPASQLIVAYANIAAGATIPTNITNEGVYKENVEWVGTSDIPGTLFNYATFPYAGLLSTYVPSFTNLQFVQWTDNTVHEISNVSFLSLRLRLDAAFPLGSNLNVSFYNSTTAITNTVMINDGQYGFNANTVGSYQFIAIPTSSWALTGTGTDFDAVKFTLSGTGGAFQIDNVILQTGGINVSSTGVITFTGGNGGIPRDGNVIFEQTDDIWSYRSSQFNADTSYEYHYNSLGQIIDSTWVPKTPVVGRSGVTIKDTAINGIAAKVFFGTTGGGTVTSAVDSIWRTSGDDSIKFSINGLHRSILDSTGGASGGSLGIIYDTVPVWNRRGIVMEGWPTAEGGNNYEPSVIFEANPVILIALTKVFKMWYTYGWTIRNIGYAESADGITWVKYASNPVITSHSRGFVLKDGSTYYNYCANSTQTQIDQYTSSDGVAWTLANAAVITPPSGNANIYSPAVIIDGATWRMLLDGYSGVTGYRLYYYTSSDGITWSIQNSGNAVMTGKGQCCAFLKKIGSTFYAWILEETPQIPIGPSDIFRVSSPDMITWTDLSTKPSFPRRTWDEGVFAPRGQIADPHLVEVSGLSSGTDTAVYLFAPISRDNNDSSTGQHIQLAIFNGSFHKLVQTKEGDGGDAAFPNLWSQADTLNIARSKGSVAIGSYKPDASAKLDITSTTQGFLMPRVTTTQMNAISSPATGLEVYNTTVNAKYIYTGSAWVAQNPWQLIGNANTDSTVNGIGTLDTKPLIFFQNNARMGYIGSRLTSVYFGSAPTSATTSAALLNSVYGWNAGAAISTGTQNTFIGAVAGNLATTGTGNTAVGYFASGAFTTGDYKTSLGWSAGKNATGNYTVAIGHNALTVANTGAFNISIGQASMNGVGAGGLNVAVGVQSLFSNTSGASNVAMGSYSGNYNTTVGSQFFINALDRASYVRDQTESLIYGKFNATVLSQSITHNAKTGIYNWSPTAYLQLPAGTTAANTAPLKLTYTNLATTATSGTGTVATVTFAAQTIPPFIVGTSIVIAGVTPAGYNGTKTVTVCTTTTVSFADATTGAQTVAGTIIQGHLLATPEPGTIEYDGDHFYGTDKTGTRIQLDN